MSTCGAQHTCKNSVLNVDKTLIGKQSVNEFQESSICLVCGKFLYQRRLQKKTEIHECKELVSHAMQDLGCKKDVLF